MICAVILSTLFTPAVGLSKPDEARTHFTPWSGYWWPTTGGGLANGYGNWTGPAPLEKYELLTEGRYPKAATQWELENHYDPDAEDWEGQCHAWAAASAYENIVFYPSSYNNIIFRVGDKKGLLTACHGSDLDISTAAGSPVIFHEWLINYIKVKRKAFIADLLSQNEVWYFPIYRYRMELIEKPGVTSVVCQIWYADDNVEADFQGIQEKTRIYTYDLFTNGSGTITGGEWTGTSYENRPRSLRFPLTPQATNPHLDYATIRSVAVHKDDHLESDEPVRLLPGNHNLILLNEDQYVFEGMTGDTISLELEKLDDFQEGIEVFLENANGDVLWEDTLKEPLTYAFVMDQAPYRLTLSRSDYNGGGIYRLAMDQIRSNQVMIPDLPKGSAWNGIALTNTAPDGVNDIQVIAYDEDHQPIATIKGPFQLDGAKKDVWTVDSIPMHLHEAPLIKSIKVLANDGLAALHMSGIDQETMAGFGQSLSGAKRMIFPDMSSLYNLNKQVTWGLINPGRDEILVDLTLYTQQGIMDRQQSLKLPANTIQRYTASTNPLNKSIDHGWVDVRVSAQEETDNGVFNGFLNWQKDGVGKSEFIYGLSRFGTRFTVPHLAATPVWHTEVTLINLSEKRNTLICQLIDGSILDQVELEMLPYEKLTVRMDDLFANVDEQQLGNAALEIVGEETFTGYYGYQTPSSRAVFELMDESSQVTHLNLPHIASDAYWWTGIALYNPTSSETQVTLSLMPILEPGYQPQSVTLKIPPMSKHINLLQSLFDASALAKAGWVSVQSVDQEIMGLFLIGDRAMNLLSGAELYQDIATPSP